jgi:DNA-binding IclR family transcriptional regulator
MDRDNADGQTIQAVERSFEIIEYLRTHGAATATEVSNELGYSSSTAHIHLKTLNEVGYVVRDDNEYSLGLRFLRAGTSVRERMPFFRAAKSEIDSLAEETGEGVGIAVEENGKRVSIYHARGADSVHDNAPIGEFTNMHWTALGKALLAYKDPAEVIAILDRHGMPKATEHTITDRDQLLEELEDTRDRGYSLETEERREGLRSIGLPVQISDTTIGAISITGPVHRLTDNRIESALLDQLREAANVIEVNYRYS